MRKIKDPGVSIVIYAVILNAALFLVKGAAGIFAHSTALQADAVNSAGDTMSSLAVYFGLRYAIKPQDKDHHYGHGKMEALISLFVGLVVLISSSFLWRSIIQVLTTKEFLETNAWALIVALVAIATKFVMYRRTLTIGRSINSLAVQTNAKDNRNDIFATSATAMAIILSLVASAFNIEILRYAEPIAAAVMSVFIIKTGIEIIADSSKMLLDAAPNLETLDHLDKVVEKCTGVEKMNWLKSRTIGRGIWVDVAIEVDKDITVEQGHQIADGVKSAILDETDNIIDVLVHVNPHGYTKAKK